MISGRERNCKECEQSFVISRDWQVFCSTLCRMRFNKRHRETCFYCGLYGNHRDHVTPQSYSGKAWIDVEYVYSCHECNTALRNQLFEIPDRLRFLIKRYTNKYKVNKAVVGWANDEVEELGPNLRKRIKRALAIRRSAEERIIYLNYVLNSIT